MKPVTTLTIDVALAHKQGVEACDEMTLSGHLKVALKEAKAQCRLTCGIYECGKLLEINPESIMLCLLPENSTDDVALHIHQTLIEAFCWENFIRVIKVDSLKNMATLLAGSENQTPTDNRDRSSLRSTDSATYSDLNCVLIEYPQGDCSPAEEVLLDFHKLSCDLSPHPVIPLGD